MVLKKIEKLAKEKGITIAFLEKSMGFGNGTIRMWEKSSPSLDKIAKVADYFNVQVDYFIDKNHDRHPHIT